MRCTRTQSVQHCSASWHVWQGDAHNYHGPLAMYLKAGFTPHREIENLVIVRRKLADAQDALSVAASGR